MPDTDAGQTWQPVLKPERIDALDATRGVALLGILLVNMGFFFEPVGQHFRPDAHHYRDPLNSAADWFVVTFCEGKFYPLFSLLFGMGMVAMLQNARAAGRRFWTVYLRRLAVLALIGFLHATLIWYGDILFIYALTGLALLILAPLCSARVLLIIAGVILSIIVLLGAAGAVVVALVDFGPQGPPVDVAAKLSATELAAPPFERLMSAFTHGLPVSSDHPFYIAAETEAFRDGPFWDAVRFRTLTWVFMLIFMLFGFIPHILAIFLIGAALMKHDFFSPARAGFRRRLLMLSAGIGIPLALLSTAIVVIPGVGMWAFVVSLLLTFISGPLIALAVLCAVTAATDRGTLGWFQAPLVSAGRMALSVYLSMSVIATGISYHWGLRQFGKVGDAAQIALALVIWLLLVAAAHLWMKRFNYGPMEWLWRTLTYLKAPGLRRMPTA